MTRRALVIGAATGTLRGVGEDVRRVERVLGARAFAVDLRTGPDASRAGILDGLERIARDAQPGDAVWFYYSGHGARVPVGTDVVRAVGRPAARDIRFLIPTDHAQSTGGDFRGITSWELSLWLASVTARTRDVTVVLDCCHAARIVRHGETEAARARGLPDPRTAGVARHLAALRDAGAPFELLDPLGNPHAVRLFAAAEVGYAWEAEIDGVWCGAMTDALVRGLERIGDRPIAWSALAAAIRERVARRFMDQRPEVAGPADRAPFVRASTTPTRRAVGVAVQERRAVLRAGAVAGVCVGDVYDVVSLAAAPDDDAAVIALATVERVDEFEAAAVLDVRGGGEAADDIVAYPRVRALPPLAVRCTGDLDARERLAQVPWLHVIDDGGADAGLAGTVAPISVERRGDLWTIADDIGPLRGPIRAAPVPGPRGGPGSGRPGAGGPGAAGVDAVAEALADLAAVAALRALAASASPPALQVVATLHRRSASGALDLAISADEVLTPGDRFVLRIDACSPGPLHVHVLELAPHGAITRLTQDATLGLPLHGSHVLGASDAGPPGIAVRWPEGLPPTTVRTLELVVIAATRPVDLGFLERRARGPLPGVRRTSWPRDVIAPAALAASDGEAAYAVVRVPYRVSPSQALVRG